ncbi:Hypothetical protein SMAX5B_006942 [Scophthalmus maximus]|uniref:Uncharacterized protein n=1 Tax=Scophthalmus maximus TaxID=52904 RepID=A0A2U9AWF4_SCOMX|nr:Hypothetical protein SMAX5B_006942 [Scophthalmus maximus]
MQRNKKSCGHMECGDGPHNQNQYMAMLKRSFHNSKIENKHLAAENAALKEELARQTSSWKEERSKLLEDRVTSVLRAQEDLDDMAAKVEMSKARQREIEMELGHMALKIKGKDMDVRNFNEHLRRKEAVIQELEAHILQRDSLWQDSVSALEQKLTSDQEANATKEGELERKLTEAEERRLTSRLDAQCQVNQMEEDINLLLLENKELQELTAMSDKDKARRQKEKKAAEREEEERQKRASKARQVDT